MIAAHTPGPGLAATPPMGWNSYNTFNCEPTETLIREVADALVVSGLKDAGYVYVNIDDGWMAKQRTAVGDLAPHPEKFPHGLKAVTDDIHSLGLKAGIYLGLGVRTYGEYPGTLGYETRDARLIASLGFDLLKYDYRELPEDPSPRNISAEYRRMRDCLIDAGRPMVYSICEHGRSRPWEWAADVGHYWRTTQDIKDGYADDIKWGLGFKKIAALTQPLHTSAGPGHWNDPDMLVVGLNGKLEWQGPGCTREEYRTHFALWCLLAAPLLIGCDVRSMDEHTKAVLTNRGLIAVNQDPLGRQGRIVRQDENFQIWTKELSGRRLAVGCFNLTSQTARTSVRRHDLGLDDSARFTVTDLWSGRPADALGRTLESEAGPHDTPVFLLAPVP